MLEIAFAATVWALLVGAALLARWLSFRMRPDWSTEETQTLIRNVAGLFVLATSLVFGLLINSSRSNFEALDNQLHTYSTHLILLDRTLQAFGPDAAPVRRMLLNYVTVAIENPARLQEDATQHSYEAEDALIAVGTALAHTQARDASGQALLNGARDQYQKIVEARWSIIEAANRSMPVSLTGMLVAWLVLIFAHFGYRAPRNPVADGVIAAAGGLISVSLYLVLDMNQPLSGPMQISDGPLREVFAELNRSAAP